MSREYKTLENYDELTTEFINTLYEKLDQSEADSIIKSLAIKFSGTEVLQLLNECMGN